MNHKIYKINYNRHKMIFKIYYFNYIKQKIKICEMVKYLFIFLNVYITNNSILWYDKNMNQSKNAIIKIILRIK